MASVEHLRIKGEFKGEMLYWKKKCLREEEKVSMTRSVDN
jgi:hypothetical protein